MDPKLIFGLVLCLYVNIKAQENSNYNAVELLSKILPLGQNQVEINPKYMQKPSELYEDEENSSKDILSRNNMGRKKRRRQRYPYPQFPVNEGHFYERPSFATEALSRVTEALTSIALYDDYQCVPRLLCEAGGGALGSSSVLPAGLQPLFTLLSAYGGVSSNPLFVFGRAVLLGVSSKDNPGSCRYAYPQCPNDPEQLVHYLNNHNGGFFRFFNAPTRGQQNLQQFYNHLQNLQLDPQNGQQYYNPYQFDQNTQLNTNQNYGLYQQDNGDFQQNAGYGLKPNPYLNYENGYGFAFPYNQVSKTGYRIEKRIQNKPNGVENEEFNNNNGKWSFPDNAFEATQIFDTVKDTRLSKTLKFPETNTNYISDYNSQTKGFVFPNNYNTYVNYNQIPNDNLVKDYKGNNYYNNYNKVNNYEQPNNYNYNQLYNYNNKNNYDTKVTNYDNNYNKLSNYYNNQNKVNNYNNANDGYVTVYVVRGNGDPNKPEIIKLRPGQSL